MCEHGGDLMALVKGLKEKGFTLLELLIVVSIITIMTVVAIFSFSRGKDLYKTDDQSLRIIDILQEARFRALSQREIMRVEINSTLGKVRIIDENKPNTADDDIVIRTLNLLPSSEVKLDALPASFSACPTADSPCPNATFTTSNHPLSTGNNVAVFRFNLLGQVLSAGSTSTGQNAAVTSSIITIWPPKKSSPTQADQLGLVRAIHIMGNSGAIQYWKYNGTQYVK
jgi:prepilin-type N-terminal cleavage/methylation domain-containing protein